jgi:hypothetical protein
MKKFVSLHFRPLPFVALFNFFVRFKGQLSAAGEAVLEAVAALMLDLNVWMTRGQAVLDWLARSAYTKAIKAADEKLDELLVGINSVVDAGRHSFGSAVKASGERVYEMLKHYGRVSRESYDAEVGSVRELLRQFTGPFAHDVDNLGLGMWVQYLQLAVDDLDRLLRLREAEQGEKPPYTAEEVRKGLEGVYHGITATIEGHAVAETAPDFAAFIDLVNPAIVHLNEEFHRTRIDISKPGYIFIEDVPDQEYTGEPVTPSLVVYLRLDDTKPVVKLFAGTDYIVTYKNNVKTGKATATIHGKGKYKGSVSITFNIGHEPFPNAS